MTAISINHPVPDNQTPWYKEVWGCWQAKDTPRLENKEAGERPLPENIYHPAGTKHKDVVRKYHTFHYVIKYKIYLPLLVILERFTDRHLRDNVDDKVYNRNLKAWNDAWEAAIIDWERHFMAPRDSAYLKDPVNTVKRHVEVESKRGSARRLRTIKALQLTLALEDTAYREFYNILMHKMYDTMAATYQDLPDGERPKHAFYTNRGIADPVYFLIWQQFNPEKHAAEVLVESTESIERKGMSVKETKMGL